MPVKIDIDQHQIHPLPARCLKRRKRGLGIVAERHVQSQPRKLPLEDRAVHRLRVDHDDMAQIRRQRDGRFPLGAWQA